MDGASWRGTENTQVDLLGDERKSVYLNVPTEIPTPSADGAHERFDIDMCGDVQLEFRQRWRARTVHRHEEVSETFPCTYECSQCGHWNFFRCFENESC